MDLQQNFKILVMDDTCVSPNVDTSTLLRRQCSIFIILLFGKSTFRVAILYRFSFQPFRSPGQRPFFYRLCWWSHALINYSSSTFIPPAAFNHFSISTLIIASYIQNRLYYTQRLYHVQVTSVYYYRCRHCRLSLGYLCVDVHKIGIDTYL